MPSRGSATGSKSRPSARPSKWNVTPGRRTRFTGPASSMRQSEKRSAPREERELPKITVTLRLPCELKTTSRTSAAAPAGEATFA